jgi:hypothetical protein
VKRWFVVFAVIVITTLMVWGSFRNPTLSIRHAMVPSDELLAYDLTPPHSVVIGLAPKSDEFRLTTWCIVGKASLEERFDYIVQVQWLNAQSKILGDNQFAFESRVSAQPESRDPTTWATRLAYSSDAITDSRTVRVKLPNFSGELPAKARLSLLSQKNERVVVRATYPEPRNSLEVRAVHEGLNADDRRALVENIASVSYDELPWALQATALSSWQRRLDAAGVEGKDFFVTRLLVGTGRASAGLVAAQRPSWFVHRSHSVAYNVKAPVDAELTAKAGSAIVITQGSPPTSKSILIGESGHASLRLGQTAAPQTVVISSDVPAPTAIQLTIAEKDLSNTFGNVSQLGNARRFELLPMVRRSVYYALSDSTPITVNIPEGQGSLGVRVRAGAAHTQGWLEARFGNERTRTTVELAPSTFEQWADESQATETKLLYLKLTPEIREVNFYGSTTLAIAPFTLDPEVSEARLSDPFDVALAPLQRWLYPRYDLSHEVPLRPTNVTALITLNRQIALLAQSRLVSTGEGARPPDTLLVPNRRTVQRHVLEPYRITQTQPIPDEIAIALDQPRKFIVPATGARAGRVGIAYRLAPTSVGNTLEWLLDGQSWIKEPTLTQGEERTLTVPPGQHTLEVTGISASDRALIEAIPLSSDGLFRKRVAYRLDPAGTLSFAFDKRAPNVKILVYFFSEYDRLFRFDWALEKIVRVAFAESDSAHSKSVEGLGVATPQTWFWETREHGLVHQYRERIVLGDDVAQGSVTLKLRSRLRSSAFVFCVLVGQTADESLRVQRFWTQEEPQQ